MIDRTIVWLFSQSRMVCDAEIVFFAMFGTGAVLVLLPVAFVLWGKK